MAESASYMRTRYNATRFGTHAQGVLTCRGVDACQHRYCLGSGDLPPEGSPCPHEQDVAARLAAEFRDRWDLLTIMPDVDDFESIVEEWVSIHLQRGRAMTRLNRSWEGWPVRRPGADVVKEMELADLYLDRLSARQRRLEQKLEIGIEKMRQRVERLRPRLDAIETFTAGKKAANEAVSQSAESLWDEFIDGRH